MSGEYTETYITVDESECARVISRLTGVDLDRNSSFEAGVAKNAEFFFLLLRFPFLFARFKGQIPG